MRDEYPAAIEILKREIAKVEAEGLTGGIAMLFKKLDDLGRIERLSVFKSKILINKEGPHCTIVRHFPGLNKLRTAIQSVKKITNVDQRELACLAPGPLKTIAANRAYPPGHHIAAARNLNKGLGFISGRLDKS